MQNAKRGSLSFPSKTTIPEVCIVKGQQSAVRNSFKAVGAIKNRPNTDDFDVGIMLSSIDSNKQILRWNCISLLIPQKLFRNILFHLQDEVKLYEVELNLYAFDFQRNQEDEDYVQMNIQVCKEL